MTHDTGHPQLPTLPGDVICCIAISAAWIKRDYCPALPCPALPCPALPCPALPSMHTPWWAYTSEGMCHSLLLLLTPAPHASVAICFLRPAVQSVAEPKAE